MNKYQLNSEKKKVNNNTTSRGGGLLLNENEATLIFNKIVFEKKTKFLDFKTFLLSFEFLSERIYQNEKLSKVNKLINFFDNFCYPLIAEKKNEGNKKENILKIISYIKESVIYSVIKDMKKILYCIYSNYSDLNEFLNFSGFFQIMKDFSIFPDIINMIQIKTIFYSLSDLFKEQIIEQIKKCTEFSRDSLNNITPFLSKQLINFEIFCEALCICTFYIKDSNNSKNEIDKLFHLLSKMSQKSKDWDTIFKSSLKSSDYKEFNIMLEYLKEKYLNEFDEGNSSLNYKIILNSPTSFDDINNHV